MKADFLEQIPEYKELKRHKQREFVRLYLKNDRNAVKSAIEAGYSAKSARSCAYEMLANPCIKAVIDKIDRLAIEGNKLTEEDVIRVWKNALESVDISWSDKLRASELVAKYRNMFKDQSLQQPIFQIFTGQDISALGLQGLVQGNQSNKAISQVIDTQQVRK